MSSLQQMLSLQVTSTSGKRFFSTWIQASLVLKIRSLSWNADVFLFKWRTQNWKMKGRETSTPRTSRGFLTRIVKAHLKLFIPLNAHSRKSRRNLQALGNVLMSEDYVVEDYVVVVDCPSEIQGKATPGSSRVDIITCRHPVRQQKGHLENR